MVQRKVGPGQFITSGASDPAGNAAFVVGDLSKVWLIANVRESDVGNIRPGQAIEFKVLSSRDRVFAARIDYVSDAIDVSTRRLRVRATVENADRQLKPEMFARVTIITSEEQLSTAVPREAIIYEGDGARVWVANDDKSLELRRITVGLINGNLVQVVRGLSPHEKVITKGALFIDRAASGNES